MLIHMKIFYLMNNKYVQMLQTSNKWNILVLLPNFVCRLPQAFLGQGEKSSKIN